MEDDLKENGNDEKFFCFFAAVTSRQNKVAASKKGIVTKHIAKWVVLGVFGYFGGTKLALRVPESK